MSKRLGGAVGGNWTRIALAVASVALVLHSLAYNFICDDAYISFRYAYNLVHHGELTYNLGERVEGYTNFLWTMLIAGGMALGAAPQIAARVLGAAAGVAALVLLYLLARSVRGGRPTAWDLVGPFLLASSGTFALWSSGGLETQLFTALTLAGIASYLAERAGRPGRIISGGLFALAAMTRPEGLLVFGLTALHRGVWRIGQDRSLRPRRADLIWAAAFLLPFSAYFIWRLAYYGAPLPNTYYAKAGAGSEMLMRWGLPYVWTFVRTNHLYLLAPLLPFLLLQTRRRWAAEGHGGWRVRPSFLWSLLLLIVVVYTAYVAKVGGDFMAHGRFLAPLLPLFALMIQEGLRAAAHRLPGRGAAGGGRPYVGGAALVLLVAGNILSSVGIYRHAQSTTRSRWETVAVMKKYAEDRLKIGSWMRKHLPPDTYLSVGAAGASPYASGLRVLDAHGLTDRWIAKNAPFAGSVKPGHNRFAPLPYVLKRRPDLLCHIGRHQDWLYHPPPGEARLWRGRGYGWVCMAPAGLRPSHYCCLKRLDRNLGSGLIEATPSGRGG